MTPPLGQGRGREAYVDHEDERAIHALRSQANSAPRHTGGNAEGEVYIVIFLGLDGEAKGQVLAFSDEGGLAVDVDVREGGVREEVWKLRQYSRPESSPISFV